MAKPNKKKSWFIILLMGINVLLIISLLLSYLSLFVSPAKIWIIAFFGIAYPYILLVNVIIALLWLFIRAKYALISLLAIALGYPCLLRTLQYSSNKTEKELKDAIKVISFNVRNFDLYNYDYKNNWAYNFEKRNKIFALLANEKPDISCFQEYVYDATSTFKTTDTLCKILNTSNKHIVFTTNSKNLNYFGIATFTKFPIIDTGRVSFVTTSGNICIYTDVLMGSDTVRIYNAHFESIRMHNEDYEFANDIAKTKVSNNGLKDKSERILKRLKRAYIIRAPQVDIVSKHIEECPYPIIFCGDFNDTPVSYAYQKISKNLKDAFIESGSGMGKSYAGIFPSFRIDYILHSKSYNAYNYETIYQELSDHYPIKCYLKKQE